MYWFQVLKDSGVFEHTWRELELWLDHVASLEPANQEPVIQLLDKVRAPAWVLMLLIGHDSCLLLVW